MKQTRLRDCERRQVLLDILRLRHDHPTADTCYKLIKLQIPSIGRSTVYRHLDNLVRSGLINSIHTNAGPARFDANTGFHAHFHCTSCGAVTDIKKHQLHISWPGTVASGHILAQGTCFPCLSSNKKSTSHSPCID